MTNQWNGSSVMKEFEKIAAENKLLITDLNPDDKDFVGNASKKTPVEGHRRYEPTEEYKMVKDDMSELLDKAHPKTVEMAKAMGAGGVVENLVQQQEKDIEIATKMPTGALYGVHAQLVKDLVNKANKLEGEGKKKEAKRIDDCLKKISAFPFSNAPLVKEAFWGVALGLLSTLAPFAFSMIGRKKYPGGTKGARIPMGISGKIITGLSGAFTILSAFGNKFTSLKEDIATDLKDLYEILNSVSNKSVNAKRIIEMLAPFLNSFSKPLDDKGFLIFKNSVEELGKLKPKLDKLISKIEIELGSSRWYQMGFDIVSRIKEKYDNFWEVFNETNDLIIKAEGLGEKMDNTAKSIAVGIPEKANEVVELQKMLFTSNPEKVTGKMDLDTIQAAGVLENNIDKALKELGYDYEVKGKIVQNGKINMEVSKLKRLIELIGKAREEK